MASLLLFAVSFFMYLNQAACSPSSVFILPLDGSKNLTFAINIPSNSSDLYIHLSAPESYSWAAIGTGDEMENSLMFIMYANASGNGITVSPRLCSGHEEPKYSSSLDVDILPGTAISHGIMTVNAKCENCHRWNSGSLDYKSIAQAWIYALGPDYFTAGMKSDAKTASIERHSKYGQFTLDMVSATGGSGGFQQTSFTQSVGSAKNGDPTSDSNWESIVHALVTTLAFVFLMPLGVIFLRIKPSNVRWHWVNQSVAGICAIVGVGIGLYLSTMYLKSEDFNATHQILGLVIVALLICQWGLGYWHHRLYILTKSPTHHGLIHRVFGWILILLAIVNGGVGLTWSRSSSGAVILYSVGIAVIIVGVTTALVWTNVKRVRKGQAHRERIGNGQGQESAPDDRSHSGVGLVAYADARRAYE